jgi:hypothetical protein
MKLTGVKPGPELGTIMKKVEDWIVNDHPDATQEDVREYILTLTHEEKEHNILRHRRDSI